MTRSDLNLGFIGLGALGLPMAANLVKAGFPLRVHTRSRRAETTPDLAGSLPCASPAEAAAGVDVLVLCVSDDAAVEAVLFGPNGAADALKPGARVLDCSTISPAQAIRCGERLNSRGVFYLDAPVTGGTEGARAGTLTVLVGGEPAALASVRPVLEVIGGTIHHFGAIGRGQQVKAVNQVLVAGSYAAVAEAMALGQRLQLPMPQVVDALKGGAAGSWTGITSSVSVTWPPTPSTIVSARVTVEATISLKEYSVYENFSSSMAGMPDVHSSGIAS